MRMTNSSDSGTKLEEEMHPATKTDRTRQTAVTRNASPVCDLKNPMTNKWHQCQMSNSPSRCLDIDATDDIDIKIDRSNKQNVIGSNLGGGTCGNKGDKGGTTGEQGTITTMDGKRYQRYRGPRGGGDKPNLIRNCRQRRQTSWISVLAILTCALCAVRVFMWQVASKLSSLQENPMISISPLWHWVVMVKTSYELWMCLLREKGLNVTIDIITAVAMLWVGSKLEPNTRVFNWSNIRHHSNKTYVNQESVLITHSLEKKEGITLGWIWKSHQAFSFRGNMKEQLHEMIKYIAPMIEYALFTKMISCQRHSDGKRVSMNAIAIRVSNQKEVSPGKLQQTIAECCKKLTTVSGGCLYG
jgi:hypothetical protein